MWILLLQEFKLEIRDKKGFKNLVVCHLSWFETSNEENVEINKEFHDEKILPITFIFEIP